MPPELSSRWQRAFLWVEDELGGKVVRAERQPRWRAAWWLDVERDGALLPLYFRGERGVADGGGATLEYEMAVLRVLEEQGIPVPHVYGFCPEPRGIVMERSPGRANLATAESEAEREAVLDHYMEILARIHAIDVRAFEAVGLERPRTPEEISLLDFDRWEGAYRRDKRRPEPAIEFLVRWVRANVPRDRKRVSFVCADAGQFLFDAGRVTAVIDLELACLGDPLADLGGMRGRDLSEPLGDLARAFRRYEEEGGEPVDPGVVDFHTVRFNLVTPLATARLVADPPAGLDFVQYLGWYRVWTRTSLEVVAHRMGVALEPAPTEDAESRVVVGTGDDFDAYRADAEARAAAYRDRCERLGPELEQRDLDDAADLLGRRPARASEADAALEAWILAADPDPARDAAIVSLLHRRALRQELLLRPVMRELAGARIQLL